MEADNCELLERGMKIEEYRERETLAWLFTLNEWGLRHLGEEPWLYCPPKTQILAPHDTIYVNEPESMLLVAKEGGRVLGLAGGIALDSWFLMAHYFFGWDAVKHFAARGFSPGKIWYVGYFLVAPEFRQDRKFIEAFYERIVEGARAFRKDEVVYMDLLGDRRAPQEPWADLIGGFENTGIVRDEPWPTRQMDGGVKDQTHKLVFYIKKI